MAQNYRHTCIHCGAIWDAPLRQVGPAECGPCERERRIGWGYIYISGTYCAICNGPCRGHLGMKRSA